MPKKLRSAGPKLGELQRWLKQIITDPRPAAEALADRSHARRAAWIHEMPPMTRAERIDVYGEAYLIRLRGAMAADFPRIAKRLGENGFADLAREYLEAHPPRSWMLSYVGEQLPAFLAQWRAIREARVRRELAALARLEWVNTKIWFAANPEDGIELGSLSPAQQLRLRVSLGPAAELLRQGERRILVYREGFRVREKKLTGAESQLFQVVAREGTLGQLLKKIPAPGYPIGDFLKHWRELGVLRVRVSS